MRRISNGAYVEGALVWRGSASPSRKNATGRTEEKQAIPDSQSKIWQAGLLGAGHPSPPGSFAKHPVTALVRGVEVDLFVMLLELGDGVPGGAELALLLPRRWPPAANTPGQRLYQVTRYRRDDRL